MKDKVLKLLRKNRKTYTSGEEISGIFGVSRAAIWKVIKQLKEDGYTIESKTKSGYRLIGTPEYLYPSEIQEGLTTTKIGKNIHYFKEIDSTNDYAKKLGREKNFQEGDIIIAETQLGGRGRFSRKWISPPKVGLYFSILLKPQIPLNLLNYITMITANTLCNAIEESTLLKPEIKWPNDILINGKKLAGILTEASGEIDKISYMVLGIGININHEDFKELNHKATSLLLETGKKLDRKKLLQNILIEFEKNYEKFLKEQNGAEIIKAYKQKSMLINKSVEIDSFSEKKLKGKVIDINDNGELVVLLENGEHKPIVSGEVTLSSYY